MHPQTICTPKVTNCGPLTTCGSDYFCHRKPPLYASPLSVFGFILIPPIIGIGLFGGLGGGVVKRPILEWMLNYDSSWSGNATDALIFASSILNVLISLLQTHPESPERPMINWEVSLIYGLAIPLSFNIGSSVSNYLPILVQIVIQCLFYFIVGPIFFLMGMGEKDLEVQKEQNQELLQASQLMTVEQAKEFQHLEVEQTALYRRFYEESCQKFPILINAIVIGNYAITEVLMLMRASPSSVIFPTTVSECGSWNLWFLVIMLVLNVLVVLSTFFIFRKNELLKEQCKFQPRERYFTPASRFFKLYFAGFAAGFTGGFIGVAAGIILVLTMIDFGLIARAAVASANYCYALIGLTLFSTLISQTSALGVSDELFFGGLAVVGVVAFTIPGNIILSKYNIGYVICFFDFGLILLNIAANIGFGAELAHNFGYNYLEKITNTCELPTS